MNRCVKIMVLLIFLFISCGRPSFLKKELDTFVINLTSDPAILNPLLAEDAYSSAIISNIYESLLERDKKTLAMKGLLAKGWKVSSDYLTYTFYLRKDVKFHDGKPFSAKDVVFTYNKLMDPKTPNPYQKVYYQDVKSIAAEDDYTIVFKMKKPYFMTLEFLGGFEILPEHIFSKVEDFVQNEYNHHNPIGTGPYLFERWKAREKVTLKRNENYWGQKPEIKRIEYQIIENSAVALQALKKRDLDYLNLTPFQWEKQSKSRSFENHFNKYKYISRGYRYIGYNTRVFPFEDKRVRKALTYLIDREKIRKTILLNLAEITTGPFWIESKQYNKKLLARNYNPAKASEYLKEAGFVDSNKDGVLDKNGKPLEFELMIPSGSSDFYPRFAASIKEDMQKAGVKINVRQIQFQALVDKLNKREFQASMLGWSQGIESDPYQLWHSSQIPKGHNFTQFTTKELDNLIEKARLEFDEEKRNNMYHRVHEILYENQPYTFLYTGYNLLAVNKRFQVEVYPMGVDYHEWKINKDYKME
ncbi:MAG: peptide-binding protein [Spirochaetia bacterium]|nr:peptide-binding protein [Spirochaetia bacterium]